MTATTRLLGLGAGGHSKVVLECLSAMGGFDVVALLDPREELWGTSILGVPVLGDDSLLASHYHGAVSHVFIGLGGSADTRPRARLFERARREGYDVVPAIHPDATVSRSASVGVGPTVLAGARVSAEAVLGDDVIVNTNAVVEHDCLVGDHVHIATGAVLASGVEVGDNVHVGAGATVIQGIRVGAGAVIGAGAVVVDDVAESTVVVGVPARALRRVCG